uniref:F-box protein 40, tandem duplicate 1 n=1 Tax=Sphaeramia orbicularis TaxID=375764 RepID=A0A673BVE4_9TELE
LGRKNTTSRRGHHAHCDSCYSRRCRARVEVSVCCVVTSCRLLCGAVFHLCKEEDHLLLCPNVRVPCLNAEYGCPLQMTRSSQAAHLQVCPASLVCCSMEWNRWPANDSHSHSNTELHENLLSQTEHGGCLDLAMALKDQDRLFHSMKMKKLFPELIQSVEEEEKEEKRRQEERRKEKKKKIALEKEQPTLTQQEREALVRGDSGVNPELLESYTAWERMFSMEMGGCREAGGAGRGQGAAEARGTLGTLMEEDAESCMGAAASNTCKQVGSACTDLSSSCRTKNVKKSFYYGHVEPLKIITVRTFKVPTSFSAKQSRIRNPGFYKRQSKGVDTSDLGVALQDMPVWEEVQASLLCSLEKEQRGHLIAETTSTDALLTDEGTQTYSFLSAPFPKNTSLADLTTNKPLELHLQLQVESVTSRHHKASSAFTFLCGHTFQRREYGRHYKNIHSDIHMNVNGWFEQRCPLAYLGCTYSQKRFQPSTLEATIKYNEELGCFSLHPTTPASLMSQVSRTTEDNKRGSGAGGGEDTLSSLPYEVLCHIASFLDSLSLSQLAMVSQLMRQVCSSLLQDRGMVSLHWERMTDSHGKNKWRVNQKVWQFSSLFSPVDTWGFRDEPSISEHLKVCPYYERETRVEKIFLPCIKEEVQTNCKGPTLVSLFHKKKFIM